MTETILTYIRETYHTEPEYLWARTPANGVFRHRASGKWFAALLGDVPKKSLGLAGAGRVPVLNLKVDPLMQGSLLDGRTIFPGYHMSKIHWISVLLDGSRPAEDILPLIDLSYRLIDQGK